MQCLLCGGLKFLHLSTKRAGQVKPSEKALAKRHHRDVSGRGLWFLYLGGHLCPCAREEGAPAWPRPRLPAPTLWPPAGASKHFGPSVLGGNRTPLGGPWPALSPAWPPDAVMESPALGFFQHLLSKKWEARQSWDSTGHRARGSSSFAKDLPESGEGWMDKVGGE